MTQIADMASAVNDYLNAWDRLLDSHGISRFLPTTCSWKVADKAELFSVIENNSRNIEQAHIGTVNNRYIASAVMTQPIAENIYILKVLERRPGSKDPLGLDSVDFLCQDIDEVYKILTAVSLPVEHDNNDMHSWLSLRFGEDQKYEAKFTDHLVIDVAVKEMRQAEQSIIDRLDIEQN